MRGVLRLGLLVVAGYALACGPHDATTRLTFSGSALGPEGDVIRRQLTRFAERRPKVRVELQVTPDSADQRHQLYVQWLNARAPTPDVLQLDVIWMSEFAAAGWILPLDAFNPGVDDFLPAALAAARWKGALYAIPWFVDVGLLYWRTDLLDRAPRSLVELRQMALRLRETDASRFGLVWPGARYEGLVTVFLEHLAAFGAGILDARGRVIVDDPAAIRALAFMANAVNVDRVVPSSALTWQEEQVRFAFQNGEAAFMRNWPYAWTLLQDESRSRVARRFAVAPFPAGDGGRPAAALGGAQLAINAGSAHPALAFELVAFLTAPEQMMERGRLAAQLPPRRSLYETPELAAALPIPLDQVRQVLEAAVPRPATPVYSELSEILQVRIHRALTGQQPPAAALQEAAREMRALLTRAGLSTEGPTDESPSVPIERAEARLAWLLVAPAVAIILLVSLVPIAVTVWEALHAHDLRLPWLGRPFIGVGNFMEAANDPRFGAALFHTVAFALISVPLELMLGLALAVMMHSVVRGRAFIRVSALLPWAIPTVVAALLWRFMFEAQTGILAASFQTLGLVGPAFDWFVHPLAAWVPIIAADVWKTTPFVAILLLAGLQTIDPALGEAARIDGASPAREFLTITLPLLTPALVVAAAFRMLDALRLFDLAYVITGGGPGTATEPLSLYAFIALMQRLRFGYGSALSVIVFLLTFVFALVWVRALGRSLSGARA